MGIEIRRTPVALLPETTNAQYRGSPWSAAFLGLTGILTIGPGFIHYFLPDGGAGVIAGLDLSVHRDVILGVFAWMGATQIPYGIAQLIVALRYRTLTPLFLLLALAEKILSAVSAWITRGSIAGHHPPENYAVLIAAPLLLIFLMLSLRPRKS
jgi:hypothetical protein